MVSTVNSTTAPMHPVQQEFHWYLANRDKLVARYRGRYLVIAGNTVRGDFATIGEAYRTALKTLKPGTFLLQLCIPAEEVRPIIIYNHNITTFQ